MNLKHSSSKLALLSVCTLTMLAPQGRADGTEVLGPAPNLVIQQGSEIRSASVSFLDGMGSLVIQLPPDTVSQSLLYWEGQASSATDLGLTDVLQVDGQVVTGTLIGGPTDISPAGSPTVWTATYRADVTGQLALAQGINSIPIQTLDSDKQRHGAGLTVVLGDGVDAGETLILDGSDFAFPGAPGSMGATTPINLDFAPAPFERAGRLDLLVATSKAQAPSLILVQFPGQAPKVYVDYIDLGGPSDPAGSTGLGSQAAAVPGGKPGAQDGLAAVDLQMWIPSGASSLTVQVLSLNSGQGPYSGTVEAELRWMTAAFNIPAMGPDLEGCTPGYWKQPQHADSWPAPYAPSDLFVDVFGVDAFPGLTLVQVMAQGGGGLNALGRHTVAALLNAASPDVNYPMTPGEVITAFLYVFNTAPAKANVVKNRLANHNEAGCPLN